MSQTDIDIASAISLSDIAAHPVEAVATLMKVVQLQGEEIRRIHAEFGALNADLKRFKVFGKTGQVDDLFEGLDAVESRLAKLESRIEPAMSDRVKSREEVLKGLLALNGGKMPAKEARQKMGLDKATFSRLMTQVDGIEVRPMKTDRRKYLLIYKENG